MGLAPFNGKACSTWRREGGLSAAEWVAAGYSPRRSSVAYLIGECFVKAGGEYAELYRERKTFEQTKVDKKIIAHRRAMRYAVKRFIRNFWIEWNRPVRA